MRGPGAAPNYVMSHVETGLAVHFFDSYNRLRPFLGVNVTHLGMNRDSGKPLRLSARGRGFYGGATYFLTPRVAISLTLTHSEIEIYKMKLENETFRYNDRYGLVTRLTSAFSVSF